MASNIFVWTSSLWFFTKKIDVKIQLRMAYQMMLNKTNNAFYRLFHELLVHVWPYSNFRNSFKKYLNTLKQSKNPAAMLWLVSILDLTDWQSGTTLK